MISKIPVIVSVLLIYFSTNLLGTEAEAAGPGRETIKMRIVVTNPSAEETKTIPIKVYLPPEIRRKEDIISTGGLELKYDSKESMYYVKKDNIELKPHDVRVFTVEVEDMWFISEERLDNLRERGRLAMARLEGSEHYDAGKKIADLVYERMDSITASQNDETIDRKDYIVIYRGNIYKLDQMKEDIETIEKYAALVSGASPMPEMLKKEEISIDMPTRTVTWMVIFIILIFIGILGAVFFFVWTHHARSLENHLSEAQKSAFPESQKPPAKGSGKEGSR